MSATCENPPMAKLGRRTGAWGMVVAIWQLWKRIPPKHRKRLLQQARKHGPKLAKRAYRARRRIR
jgi:hypothetical protein